MEHELGIDGEVGTKLEACWILLSILGKLLAQTDQHPVQPSEHIGTVVDLGLENGDTSHQDCRCLLVERLSDSWVTAFVECPSQGCNS